MRWISSYIRVICVTSLLFVTLSATVSTFVRANETLVNHIEQCQSVKAPKPQCEKIMDFKRRDLSYSSFLDSPAKIIIYESTMLDFLSYQSIDVMLELPDNDEFDSSENITRGFLAAVALDGLAKIGPTNNNGPDEFDNNSVLPAFITLLNSAGRPHSEPPYISKVDELLTIKTLQQSLPAEDAVRILLFRRGQAESFRLYELSASLEPVLLALTQSNDNKAEMVPIMGQSPLTTANLIIDTMVNFQCSESFEKACHNDNNQATSCEISILIYPNCEVNF